MFLESGMYVGLSAHEWRHTCFARGTDLGELSLGVQWILRDSYLWVFGGIMAVVSHIRTAVWYPQNMSELVRRWYVLGMLWLAGGKNDPHLNIQLEFLAIGHDFSYLQFSCESRRGVLWSLEGLPLRPSGLNFPLTAWSSSGDRAQASSQRKRPVVFPTVTLSGPCQATVSEDSCGRKGERSDSWV